MRSLLALLTASAMVVPAPAFAWGYEGHEVIADIARSYLAPDIQAKVDAILATDTDRLTTHDMASEATWADVYRGAGHRETAQWHFVDQEIDGSGDLKSACFGYPAAVQPASAGPAQDCVVDKIDEFEAELAAPQTSPSERLLALKFLLHFVGDLHQPLHAADNHDRGGNCVLLGLGGPRTVTSPAPVLDSARLRGLGAKTWRTIGDVATLNDVSVGKVLAASMRKVVVDRGRYRWPRDPALLSTTAIRVGCRLPHHPWYADRPGGVLPGSQAHVAALVRIRNHLDAIEPSHQVPVIAPLLSQPVIEACLRVPSWLWCENGMNRQVARSAFARDLPPDILNRRDKGTPGSFGAAIVGTHRREILEFLCEGQLARRGLLDLSAIATALDYDGPLRGNAFLRVSELVDVEAWLQSWGEAAGTVSASSPA